MIKRMLTGLATILLAMILVPVAMANTTFSDSLFLPMENQALYLSVTVMPGAEDATDRQKNVDIDIPTAGSRDATQEIRPTLACYLWDTERCVPRINQDVNWQMAARLPRYLE